MCELFTGGMDFAWQAQQWSRLKACDPATSRMHLRAQFPANAIISFAVTYTIMVVPNTVRDVKDLFPALRLVQYLTYYN